MIWGLVVDAGVQTLVIVVIKIVGHSGLRVGQVRKNGSLAAFEDLRFEAGPQAFCLRIIVAVAAATLRAQGLVVVQQLAVHVATVLPAAVGVDKQVRCGRLSSKSALQGAGNQIFGHGSHHVPTHYLLADHILVRAQVSPVAVG